MIPSSHMFVNTKDMAGVPVETKSGEHVGKVASFDLDCATGQMVSLHVKTKGLVHGLMADELIVPWTSVLEMTPEKAVIQDGLIEERFHSLARMPATPNPTMMKEG